MDQVKNNTVCKNSGFDLERNKRKEVLEMSLKHKQEATSSEEESVAMCFLHPTTRGPKLTFTLTLTASLALGSSIDANV